LGNAEMDFMGHYYSPWMIYDEKGTAPFILQ